MAVDVGGTGAADDEGVEEAPDVGGKLNVDDEVEHDKAVVRGKFLHVHVVIKCLHKFVTLDWKWAYCIEDCCKCLWIQL